MTEACTDRLEALLDHFPVRARIFHAGTLCGITEFSGEPGRGQIHLLRAGTIEAQHGGQAPVRVKEPSLLLYPRTLPRRFVTDPHSGADLVCGELDFEGGALNPIAAALPDVVTLPLDRLDNGATVLAMLFAEAFGTNCGRRTLIDRLFEVVLILILRQLMEDGQLGGGMLAGLSHQKLRRALTAMHGDAGRDWSLDELAGLAGMSRSAFAAAFREVVGTTPGAYLQAWRVRRAQHELSRGRSLKTVADEVGYGSVAAFSRVFKAQCGLSPREWKQRP